MDDDEDDEEEDVFIPAIYCESSNESLSYLNHSLVYNAQVVEDIE